MKNIYRTFIALVVFTLGLYQNSFAQCISSNAIYVAPNATGNGTAGNPAGLLTALAIHEADSTRNPILMAGGDYDFYQTLQIPSHLRLEGGYRVNGSAWEKDPYYTTLIRIVPPFQYYKIANVPRNIGTVPTLDTVEVAHIIGLNLDAVKNVTLSDFKLVVYNQGAVYLRSRDGYSVYAIYAIKSKNIQVSNVEIVTGHAQNGGTGEWGRDGRDAEWAMAGGLRIDADMTYNLERPVYVRRSDTDVRRCGGRGGFGGLVQRYIGYPAGCILDLPPSGQTGGSSFSVAGGEGGACGDACAIDCYYQTYTEHATLPAIATYWNYAFGTYHAPSPTAQWGQNGYNGSPGSGAFSGKGIPYEFERFYVPGTGTKGKSGTGGSGGGGAGAGGIRTLAIPAAPPGFGTPLDLVTNHASDWLLPLTVMQATLQSIEIIASASGAGNDVCGAEVLSRSTRGGNGGGGGEGGEGGGGGGGGGSVYGIYAYLSNGITTANVTYNLGDAGQGGAGGFGGIGGLGFFGGEGPELEPHSAPISHRGGTGGNGGNGGDGGNGQDGGDGKRENTKRADGGMALVIDTNRLCTNSVISIAKDPNSVVWIMMNNHSANVDYISQTPDLIELSVSMTGNIRINQNLPNVPGQYQVLNFPVTRQRSLPVFNVPEKVCNYDTVKLIPANTNQQGYRWQVYMNDSILLVDSREMTVDFVPPVRTATVTYKVLLREYESCCGWSVPARDTFGIEQPLILSMVAPGANINLSSFCQGDSITVTVNGTPNDFDSASHLIYPRLVWNTGVSLDNRIWVTDNGSYWANYTSLTGCVTKSPVVLVENALALPVSFPIVTPRYNLCNYTPVTIQPVDAQYSNFNFYASATATTPLANGANAYGYTIAPYFGFTPNVIDSVVVYVAPINNAGCIGINRSKAILYRKTLGPGYKHFEQHYYEPAGSNVCGKQLIYEVPVAEDYCGIANVSRIAGPPNGSLFPAGITTVTHRIRDELGNYTDVNTYIEIQELTPPALTTLGDFTVNRVTEPGTCQAHYNYTPPAATDNCEGPIVPYVVTSGIITGDTLYGAGINEYYYSFSDLSGNVTNVRRTIDVADNQNPIIACNTDKIFYITESDTTAYISYATPIVTDNCPGISYFADFISGFGSYGFHAMGTTIEEYRATDVAGNIASVCMFAITVTDSIRPQITCPRDTFFRTEIGLSYTTITYPAPTAVDNLPGAINIAWVSGKQSGDTASSGIYTNVWRATDIYGNQSTCSVKVAVSDREGPTLVCPNNITVNNTNGACTAPVNYTVALSLDNDLSYYTPVLFNGLPSGSAFPIGTSHVVYKVDDAQVNRSFCSFEVKVVDNVAPVFTTPCPNNATLNFDPLACGGYLPHTVLTGTDNSCLSPVITHLSGTAGDYYSMGTTTERYRISDASGNSSMCIYNVTVVDNSTLTVVCPADIIANANPGECTAYLPSYGEPVMSPHYTCANAAFDAHAGPYFPVGVTQLTYNVIVNNKHASCTYSVTVNDADKPVITSLPNMVVDVTAGGCGRVVNFTEPVGTDNCNNGLVNYRLSGLATGSLFPLGTTVQSYVVSDLSGRSDTATFTITVRDTVKPVITIPGNITTSSDNMCGLVVNFTAPVATDNSSCVTTYLVAGYNSGETFPLGTTTQLYAARDTAGNADTVSFTVTVTPVYPLQANCIGIWPQTDQVGQGTVVYYPLPGTTDQFTGQHYPCPNVQIILEEGRGSGAFFPPGPTQDKYAFIVKGTGDTVRCTTTVSVNEPIPPVIDCGTTQTYTLQPNAGSCSASFAIPVPAVSDGPNVGPVTLSHQIDGVDDTSSVYLFGPGFHTINYTAEDHSNNPSYCSINVQVVDNIRIGNTFQGQVYCENEEVDLDPMLTGFATGLTYRWVTTDSTGSYIIASTEKILHFDRLKLSDQKQYSFVVVDRCGTPQGSGDFFLAVTPAVATTLTGLASSYCAYNTNDITVGFSPAGGALLGTGIAGNKFNAHNAGKGTHIISYEYYDASTGCTGIASKAVTVYEAPEVTPFADSIYCTNAGIIQLPATGSTYTGTGINGTTYNPALAGAGNHTITRNYTENGCSAQLTQAVYVNSTIPNANITAPAAVCAGSGNYILTVGTPGGSWYGPALIIDSATGNTSFDSRAAVWGMDTITYSVTVNGCTAGDMAIINVKDNSYNLPYTFPEFCNNGAAVNFDPVDKQYIGMGFTGNVFTPSDVIYRGMIFYAVVTTNSVGCVDTNFRLLNIRGGQLNVLNPRMVCTHNDPVLVDLQSEYDSIRWWNGTTDNPKLFTDTGRYTVFLRDTMGCYGHDTLRIAQYLVPDSIVINTNVPACPAQGGLIVADTIFAKYAWSNGDTTSSITALPGIYTLTVTTLWGCDYTAPPVTVTTVPDVTQPTITCASDTVLYTEPGSCSLSGISLRSPSAFDNCGLASVTSNAPSVFAAGITNVTWTARDNANNTRTCIQRVTVTDTIIPYFTSTPTNYLVESSNTLNCSTLLPDFTGLFTADDSCSVVTLTQSPAAGNFATTGTTPVAVIATDASGNTVTQYMVFFAHDTVSPVITCPGNLTGTAVGPQTTAVVNYTAPTQAANCTNTTVQRITGLGSGAAFPIGVTTERYVVTDGNGASDTCSFNITINHVTGIVHSTGDGNLLKVVPVPATDRLTILFESATTTTLQVKLLNIAGQAIFTLQAEEFTGTYNKTIDISTHPAGTYILELVTDSEIITRKIVKL